MVPAPNMQQPCREQRGSKLLSSPLLLIVMKNHSVSCKAALVALSDKPQFDAEDVEFLALVTERFVAERWAGARDTVLEIVVEPEAVVAITVILLVSPFLTVPGRTTYPPPTLRNPCSQKIM